MTLCRSNTTTVLNNGQPDTTEDGLNAAITSAGGAGSGAYEIDLGANISVTSALQAIGLSAGVTLDSVGSGFTLDGDTRHGLSVISGAVSIENLAIDDLLVVGNSGGGGGGNAGLGGGLFVGAAAEVPLAAVSFQGDAADGCGGHSGGGGGSLDGSGSGGAAAGGGAGERAIELAHPHHG